MLLLSKPLLLTKTISLIKTLFSYWNIIANWTLFLTNSNSVSVPLDATVPCGRKSFEAESNEVYVIDNRPSQSALLSYVHQSVQSRTPASDDASLDGDEEPLGQWRQKALALPHDYEGDGDNDAAAQADDRGSRTNAKSKAPNYRSIDDDETQITIGKDESKRAMVDPWLVVINAWLTVSVIGRWCWEFLWISFYQADLVRTELLFLYTRNRSCVFIWATEILR